MQTNSAKALCAQIGVTPQEIIRRKARSHILAYAKYMMPEMEITEFHRIYYEILDRFAHQKIQRLIISAPPQHGKSMGSSRMIPSYMLGLNPDKRIAIASYSSSFAQDFNRDNQRLIDTPEYKALFPGTYLSSRNVVTLANVWLRNSNVFECMGRNGSLRVVGRGGALMGKPVDVMILDDLYNGAAEGNSPVIRKKVWEWYASIVRKRLHNDSQELIVFTRWHRQDLIGILEEREQVIEITDLAQLDDIPKGAWVKVNFEAIKTGSPTVIDRRPRNTALWEKRHSIDKLLAERKLDPVGFECLNQGNPSTAEGQLYGDNFKTYTNPADYGILLRKASYTDVADTGTDYLCTMNYEVRKGIDSESGAVQLYCLITEILYTDEPVEITESAVADILNEGNVKEAFIESNGGGRVFGLLIKRKCPTVKIHTFAQTENKESRIVTNASQVIRHIIMPAGWEQRYPAVYTHLTTFLRDFAANTTDDPEDVLTGIVEREITPTIRNRKVKQINNYPTQRRG